MPDVTLVRLNVRRVPATLLFRVTTLPAVPLTDHVPMVSAVVKIMAIVWATVFMEASSVKLTARKFVVLVPVAPPMVSLLKLKSPAERVRAVAVVLDNKMSAVPLFSVIPVEVAIFKMVPVPVNVHKPDPIDKVRVLVLFELKAKMVTE